MKLKLIALLFSASIFSSCGGGLSSAASERPKTPEELKMELLLQEQNEPLTYLSADAKLREDQVETRSAGLFHDAEYAPDGATIHGVIKNNATVAKFKDVVLIVTFYSQTDTPIETKDVVIYEFYDPNSAKNFEFKVYPPEAMAKFGVEVKSATATN